MPWEIDFYNVSKSARITTMEYTKIPAKEASEILARIEGRDPDETADAEGRLISLAKDVHAALTVPLRGLSMPTDEFAQRLKNTLFDLGEEIE